jgi:DivIVA domain-containing protein
MVDDDARRSGERQRSVVSSAGAERGAAGGEPQKYVPAEIRDVSFPTAVRGYDRHAVDAYVSRVNRVIAELQVSASPRAAVRHALEQAGQQVSGLLEQARQTAETISASGRQEAEEQIARAKAEAADLVVDASAQADALRAEAERIVADAKRGAEEIRAKARADAEKALAQSREQGEQRRQRLQEELAALRGESEARLRELHEETEAVARRRRELVADVDSLATRLAEFAHTAAARFSDDAANHEERAREAGPASNGEQTSVALAPEPARPRSGDDKAA